MANVKEGFAQLPRVDFKHLQNYFSTDEWELACEKLALSLFRHNCCVVYMPEEFTDAMLNALDAFCALTPEDLQQMRSQDSSVCYCALPGRNQFDYRISSAMAMPKSAEIPAERV